MSQNPTQKKYPKMNGVIESQRGEINRALAGDEQLRRDQLLHEQLLAQNRNLREATILELTGKIQELRNEVNCMNDSRDFQDAESVRSGQSQVTN